MFITQTKKIIYKCSLIIERNILIPFKIKFLSLETATVEELIYEANIHGFKSCVLFCHYDKYGLITHQVKELCSFFQSLGIDVIFLTTKVSDESKNWLSKNLSALIVRKNVGRDFGAWKDGINFLNSKQLFEKCSQLYLINDSVIVINHSLKSIDFKSDFIEDDKTDVIGLTESWQKGYHLQSYFLKFNQNVIHSEVFCNYWTKYPLINSRLYSIENGELGISKILINVGYSLKVLYPVTKLLRKDHISHFLATLNNLNIPRLNELKYNLFNEFFLIDFTDMNPSHRLWPLLLIDGCPVLKKDLIEKNPEKLISMRYFIFIIEALIVNVEGKKLLLNSLAHVKSVV